MRHSIPLRREVLSLFSALLASMLGACSREAALDIRTSFSSLSAGDTLSEVRAKLKLPLGTPVNSHEALGFSYEEYRLLDAFSTYTLRFVKAPAIEPTLASKSSVMHSQ